MQDRGRPGARRRARSALRPAARRFRQGAQPPRARAEGEGNVASARRVAEAEKPSVSAWAVNQLWRAHPDAFEQLFASARAIRRATRHGGEELRAATAEQRDVLARLRHLAEGVLRGAGHASNEAMLRRIATTLSALAAAGSFAPARPGQLTADRDPPGFGALAGIPEPAESSTRMKKVEPRKGAAETTKERARRRVKKRSAPPPRPPNERGAGRRRSVPSRTRRRRGREPRKSSRLARAMSRVLATRSPTQSGRAPPRKKRSTARATKSEPPRTSSAPRKRSRIPHAPRRLRARAHGLRVDPAPAARRSSELRGKTRMSSLFVSSTQVTDLGPVATLTSLDTLRMRGLDIKDLSPLANAAPRLRTLRASSTVPAALRRARPQLDAQVR